MLGRLNICSKEYLIRQYDHEVKGGSVVKPLTGVKRDGPSDAGVIRPILESEAGLVISHGICPKYSDYDAYWMMANAMDEGIRNAVAVGADPDRMAGVDNFCWCDPVQSEKTPDGEYKLAQLVRANQALADYTKAFLVPCISGKDSMKNDSTRGGRKISIPPSLLFSMIAKMDDVSKAVTPDAKQPGDLVYVIGMTRPELGGSEYFAMLDALGNNVPKVDAGKAKAIYKAVSAATEAELVHSLTTPALGGLAVAFARTAMAGRLGLEIDLDAIPAENCSDLEKLFSESNSRFVATVPPANRAAFEEKLKGVTCALVGTVTMRNELILRSRNGRKTIALDALLEEYKGTLDSI